MSAVKIIFKRSSILGKRPTGANLEAGEIGLNTNSTDPGLFFEVNDGSVVKAGPTSYLPIQPTTTPARGELWVDSDTKGLSIGTNLGTWQKVAAPYLGGTNGLTVFVAPDYENATDSLSNDGQTVPFVTINRAIIEVTKNIIQDTLSGLSLGNNRYLIILAPGQHCVCNHPGSTVADFTVNLDNPATSVTAEMLSQFNPDGVGGLILPRGVSIIGLDLKKCEVRPTYVPKYTHPAFPAPYRQQVDGPAYENQLPSSIFKWSGNTYVSNFCALDKVDDRLVTQVEKQDITGSAIFKTERPHGLDFNDFVQIDYQFPADQAGANFRGGQYYVYPLNSFEFLVSLTEWFSDSVDPAPVPFSDLPSSYAGNDKSPKPKFRVLNIYPYFIPLGNEQYEYSSYSHHRLSVLKNASVQQLNDFYTKVQKAFSSFFGNTVSTDLASSNPPEYEIVSTTAGDYPNNVSSNSTDNSSPYQNMVNHRSDYGMANGDYDSNVVSGFKSVIINSSTAVVLQKDPVAYEIYSTIGQNWIQLTQYVQESVYSARPITSIRPSEQLKVLNNASIPNIRYYYTTLSVNNPQTGLPQSTGIADPDNDFRHFGFRLSGPNSYMQAQSTYCIGTAIAAWARGGALISLTNATTNFGSVGFQAEGFAGIGTLGGANPINKGFLLSGVVRPLQLLEESVTSDEQKRILYLGSKVVFVGIDPSDPSVQLVYLQAPFDPASILPFSLRPGSALFVSDSSCSYRAFFVTNGTQTCITSGDSTQNPYSVGGAVLRVRLSDSTIPNTPPGTFDQVLDVPFIRRFVDPRTPSEQSYGFYVKSTNSTSQAPQLGSVLRLNQTGQSLSDTLKRNVQFDPGENGGISQVFTIDYVETARYSSSPNFNYKISDTSQSTEYVLYSTLTDASTPWVQSVPSDPNNLDSDLIPFFNPQGSYVTYQFKNYYAAENNTWSSLYYKDSSQFNPLDGPTKVTPDKGDSPFVVTSVIEKTEPITSSWQGSVPDPYYEYYTTSLPPEYSQTLSYFRGAVIPYQEFGMQYQVDDDDSSNDMGIIFKKAPLPDQGTVLVSPSKVTQTPVKMSSPYAASPTFGRPEVMQIELLSVQQVILPKEGVSILELTNPIALKGVKEYVRVISLNSNILQVIRNYYPQYAVGTLPGVWPAGTIAKVCVSDGYPQPSVYDPNWAPTKATIIRFYQLMGYGSKLNDLISTYLQPKFSGERILFNTSLPYSPFKGYAAKTAEWPIEFNNPSSIIANTHTWQYVGYFDYSRGLPKYQVNEIPKKLSYDYLCTTVWGGRLTVMGANETGQLIFLGPIKEAITSQFFETQTPLSYATNRQVYSSPQPVTLPNPVLVYSADDISGQFNGSAVTFSLTRGGYRIPSSQISTYGVFVILGGVVQKPNEAYTITQNPSGPSSPQIAFTEAPLNGTSCDIRIITSDDQDETLEVVPFTLSPSFDGIQTSFSVSPNQEGLTDLNSFVFLGGTEQNPAGLTQTSSAYTISTSGGATTLSFIGGSPQPGTVTDVRGILSGTRYRNAGVSTVFVASVDDIAPLFNNTSQTFPLEIGGLPLDPTKVNEQNMFVSLGGVMQIPIAQRINTEAGEAYSVSLNPLTNVLEITFDAPPAPGTTCNIRVVTSEESLTCPIPPELLNTNLQDGPGITVNDQNQIIAIDPGLIQ